MKSWYPNPKLTLEQLKYLKAIQEIFKVKNIRKEWIPYILTPHQQEWHADDIAILKQNAKSRIAIKSRNTSFTTSCLISNLTSVYDFPNNVVPYVRLNESRAKDLIQEEKELIRHMTPLKLENGAYYPFNPKEVNMDNTLSIKFPNGVEHRAFAANSAASETIRGFRIAGSAGILDETAFMKDYNSIYIAMRDASAGSDNEEVFFQMNIGTTLKGQLTPFKIWYDNTKAKINDKKVNNFKIYEWPIVDPAKYNNPDETLLEKDLIPIVSWQSLKILEQKRLEDPLTFAEEYLGQAVDSDKQFYPTYLTMGCVDSSLIHYENPLQQAKYVMGIDPASINDFFAISIFKVEEIEGELDYTQVYLFFKQKIELEMMTKYCNSLINIWKPLGLDLVRCDANGIGLQLAQTLQKNHQDITIEKMMGSVRIDIGNGLTKPLKEFQHTHHKKLMTYGHIHLLQDQDQIRHYSGWNYNWECPSTKEYGHGDIVSANLLATLPVNYKTGTNVGNMTISNNKKVIEKKENTFEEFIEDKLKRLTKQKRMGF
jgi:hypothetical protein